MMKKNNLNLDNEVLTDNEDVSMKDYDINKIKKELLRIKRWKKISLILFVILGIFFLVIYSLYSYFTKYFYGKKVESGISYYSYWLGKNIKEFIIDRFFFTKKEPVNLNISSLLKKSDIRSIDKQIDEFLHSNLSYVQKKQIMVDLVNKLYVQYRNNELKIQEIIKNISNYAFLPKEIDSLIKGGDISNILYAVDGLKIMSLMSVYKYIPSYMEEFINGIGRGYFNEKNLGCKQLELAKKISYYLSRGDKDIKLFLKMCYLNPYENDRTTCKVGEFDYYYNYILKIGKEFDPDFFKLLVSFIISKINNPNYSNIEIVFNNLNPITKELGFTSVIRTYKEDIEGFNNLISSDGKCNLQGLSLNNVYGGINNILSIIKNLHVYLIVTYLNFLRQSRLIEGDDIRIKQLKIILRKDKLGNVYEESKFSFKVKLQPDPIREIYDFIYGSK